MKIKFQTDFYFLLWNIKFFHSIRWLEFGVSPQLPQFLPFPALGVEFEDSLKLHSSWAFSCWFFSFALTIPRTF